MGRGQSAVSQVAVTSTSSPGRRTVALDGLVVMTRLPGGLPWYRPRHAEGLGDSAQAADGSRTTGRTTTEPAVTTMRARRAKGKRRMDSPGEGGGVRLPGIRTQNPFVTKWPKVQQNRNL